MCGVLAKLLSGTLPGGYGYVSLPICVSSLADLMHLSSHEEYMDRYSHGTPLILVASPCLYKLSPVRALSITNRQVQRQPSAFPFRLPLPQPSASFPPCSGTPTHPRALHPLIAHPQRPQTNLDQLPHELQSPHPRRQRPLHPRRHLFSHRHGLPPHQIQVVAARAPTESTAAHRRALEPAAHVCGRHGRIDIVRMRVWVRAGVCTDAVGICHRLVDLIALVFVRSLIFWLWYGAR